MFVHIYMYSMYQYSFKIDFRIRIYFVHYRYKYRPTCTGSLNLNKEQGFESKLFLILTKYKKNSTAYRNRKTFFGLVRKSRHLSLVPKEASRKIFQLTNAILNFKNNFWVK